MKAVFNESALQRFNLLAAPLVVIWSLSTLGGTFLSNSPTERFTSQLDPFFEIFNLGQKFGIAEHFDGAIHSKSVTATKLVPDFHRIKAIYRSASDSFVSISDTNTTLIVPLGGIYKSVFRLTVLSNTTATFRGYGKSYLLRLGHDDPLSRQEVVTESVSDSAQSGTQENEWRTIPYQTIKSQMNDFQNIGKNIDISEVVNGAKIAGFRVNKIAPESIFAQLGIINGDIILAVNNKKLESYADALAAYSEVPNLRSIRIIVNRNNLQKELVYEITR
ncbi:MAG: PDZ domain-containing protein [Campylobacterales bacterium]|nr:PDZ domain-containing protein [Campylobacterales bacterium]